LTKNEKEIVKKGYDKIADKYLADRANFDHTDELQEFSKMLPENARVLDVGCGAGVPVTRFLINSGFVVTGVDFSQSMLRLAEKNVPKARLIEGDMTRLDFNGESFDGITAFYSIIHVPKESHFSLFQNFNRILKPKGLILVSMGREEWEATDHYYGARMFWSHYSPEKSSKLVRDAGFRILWDRFLVRGGEKHYWILAQKRATGNYEESW
jgi:ubiquinone/menaquinone biosynthesis C-methylase UbiE